MGLLSTPAEGAADPVDIDDKDETQEASPEPAPKPETVQFAPQPKEGRRARAERDRDNLAKEFESFKERFTKDGEELRRQLSERDQVIAQLRGNFEAMSRQAAPVAPQSAAPEELIEKLDREATELLDKGDLAGYRRKERQIAAIEAEKALVGKYGIDKRQQVPSNPGMDPRMQMVLMSTPAAHRMMSDGRGRAMVQHHDAELAAKGYQDGPERWKLAFELADADIAKLNGGNGHVTQSKQSRETLSGVPAGRGSAAGTKEPSVKLPANWKQWADGAGMTKDEYARIYAQEHPEAVED